MRRFLSGALTVAVMMSATVVFAGNQETADQIAANLKHYGNLSGQYSLDVKVESGTATLSGWLADQQQLDRVVEIARRTPGVTLVMTDLSVRHMAQSVAGSVASNNVMPTAIQVPQEPTLPAPEKMRVQIPEEDVQPIEIPKMTTARVPTGPTMANQPLPIGGAAAQMEQPNLPEYAWPSYAAHPNYAGVTYPRKYEAECYPNIGPFYPYPDVPAEWRKVTLEWHDGYWFLDFDDGSAGNNVFSGLFRPFH